VLLDLARQFPRDLSWVLRVDGHADRSPIRGGGRFATNWELSAARAIAVAQLLIAEGLPPNRVAAAAFGDTQPLDDRDTPDAYARNRRIELRLEAGPAANAQPAAAPAAPTLRAAAAAVECALLTVQDGTPPRVTGVAPRAAEARLRALPGGPALGVAAFQGPYCPLLDALRALPAGVQVEPVGARAIRRGGPLRLDVTMPDWAAHLHLVFVANDGAVAHLARLGAQAPGARLRLGEAGWVVDEPFGTDLVIAIASEAPLFAAPREAERVAGFEAALRAALAQAQAGGRRVAVGATVVEVVR
jgi:chemotaxis protein MotB